jgi:HEAT repeat protein
MKRLTTLLVLAASLGLSAQLSAHGGTYKGPGDTVPPGGGGASTPTPPSTPATPGAPSTPSTPGTPGTPNTPNTPSTPPSAPGGASAPTTGGQADQTDLSTWQFWWEFNKDRFLNLRAKIHSGDSQTDGVGVLTGLGGGAQQNNTSAPSEQQILTQVLPALHAAVKGEKDQDILTGVMIALAKCGRDNLGDARKLYLDNLDAQVQEVAETAAISFGILKDASAIDDVLLPLLTDTPVGRKLVGKNEVPIRTRTFAAYGIGLVGSYSKDPGIKQIAATHLFDALMADKSALKDIRVASIIGLGLLDLQDPSAIADVVNRLSEYLAAATDDDIVLAHVPNAMAKLLRGLPAEDLALRDKVLDQTLELIGQRSKAGNLTKMSAVQALGMLARPSDPRSKDIFAALEEASDKAKDQQVRNFTAISMAYLGSADPDFDSEQNKQPVTKFLLANLKKSNTSYEMWSGLALGVMAFQLAEKNLAIPDAVNRAVLDKLEESKSSDQLSAYALALGLMDCQGAVKSIRDKMEDNTTGEFLGYGSIALGLLQARGERGFLMQIIDEKRRDEDLLKQAAIGLGLMKDKTVVKKLLDFMNPTEGRPTLSVLASTATAIGFIGDTNSISPLIETLRNVKLTALGRAFAAEALGMVGDKETMPWNSRIGEDLNYRASVSTLVEKSVANGILDIL